MQRKSIPRASSTLGSQPELELRHDNKASHSRPNYIKANIGCQMLMGKCDAWITQHFDDSIVKICLKPCTAA